MAEQIAVAGSCPIGEWRDPALRDGIWRELRETARTVARERGWIIISRWSLVPGMNTFPEEQEATFTVFLPGRDGEDVETPCTEDEAEIAHLRLITTAAPL
jgi:hypothetical protein